MAKLMRAELELDGRNAVYDAGFVIDDFDTPILMLSVQDFEEAQEIVATLERSFARKRKDSPAAATVPPTVNVASRGQEPPQHRDPPKCIAPDCIFDRDVGDTCRDHAGATEEQKEEWRKGREVTPTAQGKAKARAIRERLDDTTTTEVRSV